MELAKKRMQEDVNTVPTPCDNGCLVEILEENRQLSQEIDSLRAAAAQLKAIADSRGYRFLQALYSIRLFLLPHLSIREQLAARAYRFFRAAAYWPRNVWKSGILSRSHSGKTALRKEQPLPGFAPPEGSSRDADAHKAAIYAPLNWRLNAETRSDHDFIKLIILSPVHRSGSTLLQRICNARKGTLIWGEHGGLLAHFADIYRSASFYSVAATQERIQYFSRGENPNLWIGSICPELDFVRQAVVESARTFLNTMYGQYRENHDVIGFKEVHYARRECELLRRCYPQTEILLLVRNPLNTWNSTPRAWYSSLDEWIKRWRRNAQYFMALAKADPRCHLLKHEDVVGRKKETMSVLADTAKVSAKQIHLVLENKIGSAHVGIDDTERQTILRECGKTMGALGYE
jgi:hypothetical protein